MKYSVQQFATRLKERRVQKGLSQRDLSLKTGIPQSHLSKIERGTIDLQVSTLIELSRILDLELMLVPRTMVPTVTALLYRPYEGKQQPMYPPEEEEQEEEVF